MAADGGWRLILDPLPGSTGAAHPAAPGALPAARNMAVDQVLLASAVAGGAPVLRLYGWSPHALSFGRNEPAAGRYDAAAASAEGLDLVRRPTGGLAVHHACELTYAVAGSVAHLGGPRAAYLRINRALVEGLRAAGVPAELATGAARLSVAEPGPCFAVPAAGEVVCGGRKLVGSAQRREAAALLQHGSILLGGDQSAVLRLRVGAAPAEPPRSTTVAEVLGHPLPPRALVAPLVAAFEAVFGTRLAPGTLTFTERARMGALEAHFRSAGWTWRR